MAGIHSYFVSGPEAETRAPSVAGEIAKCAWRADSVTERLKVNTTGESVGTSFCPFAMLASTTEVGSVLR